MDGDAEGIVVFSIDTNEYAADFPKSDWEYLQRGVMIEFTKYGLIYFDEDNPELALVRRGP
ncbi:hypothetical protein H8A95_28835 [Bradyrhizobium sp. Pear76]|uniref:hypothetical protein n=1 Tax=Bradyrhizobium oropedii TaxID=1571201 RepID=UPI001E42BFF9|nr:hypothetical protein [Bradyrhizobium oropedii]MCC8966221.1 hypothetical protein [Bradyrhizobium oropedii]